MGDLTVDEYCEGNKVAKRYINQFNVKRKLIVPGNYDSRNVGYRTFEKFFGNLVKVINLNNDVIICGADSTEPDLDNGQIGRYHTMKLKKL